MTHLKDGLGAREGCGERAAEEDEEPPFTSRGTEVRVQEVGGEGKYRQSDTKEFRSFGTFYHTLEKEIYTLSIKLKW